MTGSITTHYSTTDESDLSAEGCHALKKALARVYKYHGLTVTEWAWRDDDDADGDDDE